MKRIVETMLCLAVLCIHEAITPQNAVGIVRLK